MSKEIQFYPDDAFEIDDARLTLHPNAVIKTLIVDADGRVQGADQLGKLVPDQVKSLTCHALLCPGSAAVWVHELEVAGERIGLAFDAPLKAGETYDVDATISATPDVGGLAPGTMIMTADGECPVEWLEDGVRVLTRDHGSQPLRHVLRLERDIAWFAASPGRAMIEFPQGFTDPSPRDSGINLPAGARIMMRDPMLELMLGTSEALVQAQHLADLGIGLACQPTSPLTMTYLVFDRPEIICTEGIWIEPQPVQDLGNAPPTAPENWQAAAICASQTATRLYCTQDDVLVALGHMAIAQDIFARRA